MTNRSIVRLKIISSTLSPETLNAKLALRADKDWRIGELREHTKIVEKMNGWVLGSGLSEDSALDTQIEALLVRVAPVAHIIRAVADEAEIEVSCVIYADEPPALNFSTELLNRICQIGAGLDVDLYLD